MQLPIPSHTRTNTVSSNIANRKPEGGGGRDGDIAVALLRNDLEFQPTGINARANEAIVQAAKSQEFRRNFTARFEMYTKYGGCIVCDIAQIKGNTKHRSCVNKMWGGRNKCKCCGSEGHFAKACPARKHKHRTKRCAYCLLGGQYHEEYQFTLCPNEWNDLLWNAVFLMREHRLVEFRILMNEMGCNDSYGNRQDISNVEALGKFLSENSREYGEGVNGFMVFFTKWKME